MAWIDAPKICSEVKCYCKSLKLLFLMGVFEFRSKLDLMVFDSLQDFEAFIFVNIAHRNHHSETLIECFDQLLIFSFLRYSPL